MVRPFTTRNDHKFDVKSKTVVGGRLRLTESALDMLVGVKAPYGWQQVFVEKLRAVFNVAGHLRWSILRWNVVLCKLQDYSHLAMIPYCRNLLEKELVEWHKWYLPQKSIEGKTVLDVGAGCLPRGHLILGATKDISEYQAAEPVFSSRGLSLVTETHARPYSGRLYDIKGQGLLPFSLTPEHPVLVARTHLSYKGELHKSARRVVDGLEWRRAKDIRPMVGHRGNGDCLVFPKLKLEAPVPDFPLEYGRSPPDRYGRVTVKLEEQMAELLGLYVAEGDSQSVVGLNFGS